MRIGNLIRWAIAIALVTLSFMNASWIAPVPNGAMAMVASKTADKDGCATLEGVRRALIEVGGPVVLDTDAAPGCLPAKTALEQFPRYRFILKTHDADKALALFADLKRPIDERYAFVGDEATVAAIRAKAPEAQAWTIAEGRACFSDYVKLGWLAMVPESCRGKAIIVPLDQKWKVAGWPKRFQTRMAAAKTQMILAAPGEQTDAIPGLTQLEQIPEVPRDYMGWLWVDDAALIGPSVRR